MNELLAQICADQQNGWVRGKAKLVEDYLAHHPQLRGNKDAVVDLIYSELLIRSELGQAFSPAEYFERFPDYEVELRKQFALHQILRAGPTRDNDPALSANGETSDELPDRQSDEETTWVFPPGYEVIRKLGSGSRGVVFEVCQLCLGRHVALKMVRKDKGRLGTEQRELFRSEAQTIARLQHTNIVQIFDFGEHEGQPYFAMELMEGGSLRHKLAQAKLPPRQAAALVERLASAAHVIHEAGIVHRDLKPSNVLLTKNGEPKICDFGLTKVVQEANAGPINNQVFVGTPAYMAPEQAAENGLVGPAADIYALGVILFEAMTNVLPFVGNRLCEVLIGMGFYEPPSPREFDSDIPVALEAICLRCLRRRPEERFRSASAMAHALRQFLDQQTDSCSISRQEMAAVDPSGRN